MFGVGGGYQQECSCNDDDNVETAMDTTAMQKYAHGTPHTVNPPSLPPSNNNAKKIKL